MKQFLIPISVGALFFSLAGCATTTPETIHKNAPVESRNTETKVVTATPNSTKPAVAVNQSNVASAATTSSVASTGAGTSAPPVTLPPTVAAPAIASNTSSSTSKSDPMAEPVVVVSGSESLPPLAAADLWDRMRSGFKMAEMNTQLVAEKEKFYLSKPEYLDRMFNRGSRYLYFIMEEIDKRGMPMELALLPFVESAMNPTAMSHAKASGLWQFIPSTGRQYNLSQNWWVDNRRDVQKATIAALEYLDRIYKMQGNDWFLALASYNWGEGSVQRAMRANAARGMPTDYLSINMPAETRHYVPKLIALRNIVMRSKELGIKLPDAPNQPYFVSIEKSRPIDLQLAAKFAGMNVADFVSLNPAHNRPVIAATKNNQILIPRTKYSGFVEQMEVHAQANRVFATWQPRTISSGESLESIAAAGGITVAELRSANGVKANQRILPGTRIIAPQAKVKDESAVESFVAPRIVEAINLPPQRHVVGKKENLNTIAKRYGISAASLKAWNGIKKGVARGMSLVVRPAVAQTVVTHESGVRQVVASANQAQFIPVKNEVESDVAEQALNKKTITKAGKKTETKGTKAKATTAAATKAKSGREIKAERSTKGNAKQPKVAQPSTKSVTKKSTSVAKVDQKKPQKKGKAT